MSKCDLKIEFDRPDRQYRPGEEVTGTVHVRVNREVQCNGLVVEHFWQTHGRGNRATGTKQSRVVFNGQWMAGESASYPFSFTAPAGPPTYRGHYLNVDHYVRARVDIPWALDPKKQEEYLLQPGSEPYGNRPDPRLVQPKSGGTGMASLGTGVGLALLIFGVILCFPFGFVMIPAGAVILFFSLRKVLAEKKLGKVDLQWGSVNVAPGGHVPLRLAFAPGGSARINAITAQLTGVERCVSGSGTNKSTHTHKLHNRTITLSGERTVSSGQPVRLECNVPIPQTKAYSFSASDNDLIWELEVRIDIPLWPDWIEKRVLTVRPNAEAQAVEATIVDEETPILADVVAVDEPAQEGLATPIEEVPDWPADDTFKTVADESMPLDDLVPAEPPPVAPAAFGPTASPAFGPTASPAIGPTASPAIGPIGGQPELVGIAESILAASRFGFERERIVEENADRTFACTLSISKIDRTYSYASDDRLRNGRTIIGRIDGTECEASLLTLQSRNEEIDQLDFGQIVEAQCVLLKWNTIYDRLEMREV
ncbi:MAG TPA: hypothetical protein VE890_04380 [Thermoguttaceae bacterium]|nr:hypothetical protein [Thermoguttaceae bacterium]